MDSVVIIQGVSIAVIVLTLLSITMLDKNTELAQMTSDALTTNENTCKEDNHIQHKLYQARYFFK